MLLAKTSPFVIEQNIKTEHLTQCSKPIDEHASYPMKSLHRERVAYYQKAHPCHMKPLHRGKFDLMHKPSFDFFRSTGLYYMKSICPKPAIIAYILYIMHAVLIWRAIYDRYAFSHFSTRTSFQAITIASYKCYEIYTEGSSPIKCMWHHKSLGITMNVNENILLDVPHNSYYNCDIYVTHEILHVHLSNVFTTPISLNEHRPFSLRWNILYMFGCLSPHTSHVIRLINIRLMRFVLLKHEFQHIIHQYDILDVYCRYIHVLYIVIQHACITRHCSGYKVNSQDMFLNNRLLATPKDTIYSHEKPPAYNIGGGCPPTDFKMPNIARIRKHLIFRCDMLQTFIPDSYQSLKDIESLCYLGCTTIGDAIGSLYVFEVPLQVLSSQLPRHALIELADRHMLTIGSKRTLKDLRMLLSEHHCTQCLPIYSVFSPYSVKKNAIGNRKLRSNNVKEQKTDHNNHQTKQINMICKFPPDPPSNDLLEDVCNGFINDSLPSDLKETGCAVCGVLTQTRLTVDLDKIHDILSILNETMTPDHITRKERKKSTDPIESLHNIPIAPGCDKVCNKCMSFLSKERIPPLSLANGLWIGEVPTELSGLSFAEKMTITRVRHNACIVRVSSGMHKMKANAILYQTPMPKIYDILPPHCTELDDVLAVIYTGPCKPTNEDFKRTPFLIRRNKVAAALNWLKLNHADYSDIIISSDNLLSYPENMPPVTICYRTPVTATNQDPESTGLDNMDTEDGTIEGECPMTVHGITGQQLSTMDVKTMTAIALDHLTNGGKVLAIGHAEHPESIYNNPRLYPQMFPWLFPYGLGGLGNSRGITRVSEVEHKKHLLMYYDKRFQLDPYFPIIALNHEQIKAATTSGFLLSNKQSFPVIADQILSIDPLILQNLANRMALGEHVDPQTDKEKTCFQLIRDLDHIARRVDGSITSKKHMRNEIWSLISAKGAPSWFITFSPTDVKHPICLYYADTKEIFEPDLLSADARYRLIANNPVAGARFFHVMVSLFIKHVLGVGTEHPGIYGDTSAYYGTVEQQGRLTLHLHLLLWLKGNLTPQEIRDRLHDPSSNFQTRMISYLESVHTGDFVTGNITSVKNSIDQQSESIYYNDPTMTMPEPAPKKCNAQCLQCEKCKENSKWWMNLWITFDDILYKSNRHQCSIRCTANHTKSCKARFPRETREETTVDPETGSILLKKREPYINTVTPYLTYLLRCNTDVTSLLSGTAIKAVIAYTTEYVTKTSLKTHTVFDIIRCMMDRKC